MSDGIGYSFFDGELEIQTILLLVSDVFWIPATLVAINLIKKVSSFEKQMYEKAILEGEDLTDKVIF